MRCRIRRKFTQRRAPRVAPDPFRRWCEGAPRDTSTRRVLFDCSEEGVDTGGSHRPTPNCMHPCPRMRPSKHPGDEQRPYDRSRCWLARYTRALLIGANAPVKILASGFDRFWVNELAPPDRVDGSRAGSPARARECRIGGGPAEAQPRPQAGPTLRLEARPVGVACEDGRER